MGVKIVRRNRGDQAENVTLRLPGKLRHSLELLAQKKGTSLSRVMVEALEQMCRAGAEGLVVTRDGKPVYLPDLTWDALEPDRLIKLATNAPDLMTDEQAQIWKVIQEDSALYRKQEPQIKGIRERWSEIKATAKALTEKFGR